MNARHIRTIAAFVVSAVLLVAGCSSASKSSTATSSSAAPTTTTTQPTTTTQSAAAVTTEVTTAYTTFFAGFAGDPGLLESGDKLAGAIKSLQNAQSKGVTVAVKSVNALDAAACTTASVPSPCAKVSFDLNVNGAPAVPNQTGYAVQENGKWKVAKTTFCSLAALSGSPPAGC